MTQATFLYPHVTNRNAVIYGSSQAEFAALTFMNGSPASMMQGPRLFEGGRPGGDGTGWCCTHDDIFAAGNVEANELRFVQNAQGETFNTIWYGLRVPSTHVANSRPNGCIFVTVEADFIVIHRRNLTGGAEASLGGVQLSTTGKNIWPLCVRAQVTGTAPASIKLKVWPATIPEPAAWDVETTYSDVATTGIPVVARTGSSWAGIISHFSLATGADVAPPIFGTISGNVFISPDTGVARTVRAISRTDPLVQFSGVSGVDGAYTIPALMGHVYSVFSIDPDGGTYKSPIKDKITPVAA